MPESDPTQADDWEEISSEEQAERLRAAGKDLLEFLENTADPNAADTSVWNRLKNPKK